MSVNTQTSQTTIEPQFEAEVQIGKGLRFIDRNGIATVAGGHLILRKHDGEVIVNVPISQVCIQKARFSAGAAARVSIGDDRYTIEPTRMTRFAPGYADGSAINLARDISRLKKGKELTRMFRDVVWAAGGRIDTD